MKVGDKVTVDDFPGAVATVIGFELQKKVVWRKKTKRMVEEIRTKYDAKFDGTNICFVFYGFDIGKKVKPVKKDDEYRQLEIFEMLND